MQNMKTEKKRSRFATFSMGEVGYETVVKINPDHVVEFEETDSEGVTIIRTESKEYAVNSSIDEVEELLNRARM